MSTGDWPQYYYPPYWYGPIPYYQPQYTVTWQPNTDTEIEDLKRRIEELERRLEEV